MPQIFVGKVIRRLIAEEKPRRGGVALEFDDFSCVYLWCEVVDLEGWEVTGALRVIENFSLDKARGVATEVGSLEGVLISSMTLIYADFEFHGARVSVANGLVLVGLGGEKITVISSSGAGPVDFGIDVGLDALEAEYPAESYRFEEL